MEVPQFRVTFIPTYTSGNDIIHVITVLATTFSDVRTNCPDVLKMVRQCQNLVRHHAIVFSAYAWNGA